MIAVAHEPSSLELLTKITNLGVKAYKEKLPGGDYAFEGYGPDGRCAIGIERKKLDDMIDCITTGRFSGHQRIEMTQLYQFRFLIVEGIYRPEFDTGLLQRVNRRGFWDYVNHKGRKVMFSTLSRNLISTQAQGGTFVMRSCSDMETAFMIVDCFHYFQKPWNKHRSAVRMHTPALASMGKPTLLREWLSRIDGVGELHSEALDKKFRTVTDPKGLDTMWAASEVEWMIPGIGAHTARKIWRQLHG